MVNNPKIFPLTSTSEPHIDWIGLPIPINIMLFSWNNWENHYLFFWSLYQSSHGPEVSFDCPWTCLCYFCHCQLEQPIVDSNQRALVDWRVFQCPLCMPLGDNRLPCELYPVFVLGPLFPWKRVSFYSFPSFLLKEVEVLMLGTC